MSRVTDIENLIRVETENCAFQTKRSGTFIQQVGKFFTAQRKYEPQCELKARQKYASQLEEARNIKYEQDDRIFDLFSDQASVGLDPELIKIIVIVLVAVILIAWILS